MTMKTFILSLALFLLSALPVSAQTYLRSTTLSAAITNVQSQFNVASATGITVNQTVLFVNTEAMLVTGLSGTLVTVTRGYQGTLPVSHPTSTTVVVVIPGAATAQEFNGSCTLGVGQAAIQPRINFVSGNVWLCRSSLWTATNPRPITYNSLTLR
jgi:predicted ABC-type sugar transport system permease subunit